MFTMAINTLEDLFMDELKDLYDAEHQILEALPKMAEAATARELKTAFNNHLTQTKGHVARLEQIFKIAEVKPARKTCDAMKGIIKEGDKLLKEAMPDAVKDAALIAAAQRVEHYEMAGYGTLRTFAYVLGYAEVAPLLQATLDEEEETDKKLTQVANQINLVAAAQPAK
jgi:ferritin-like metal-binding protein YciE